MIGRTRACGVVVRKHVPRLAAAFGGGLLAFPKEASVATWSSPEHCLRSCVVSHS
jgi:hypothetical protein